MLALRPAIFDRNVVTLNIAGLAQTLAERAQTVCPQIRRQNAEKSDHRHRRLLRACRKRPGSRRADQRNELALVHSITSSARASRIAGISRPIAFAALVEREFELGGLLHRKIARLLATQNAIDVFGGLAKIVPEVDSIGDE